MASLRNIHRISYLLRHRNHYSIVRIQPLFTHNALDLANFKEEKRILGERMQAKKGYFYDMMKKHLEDGKDILTVDLRGLIYLAETEHDAKLVLEARQLYVEQQKRSHFPSHLNSAELILVMYYLNNQTDLAYEWFQEKVHMDNEVKLSSKCFFLMMNMLFMAERYDDVISVMEKVDIYLPKPTPELLTLYFGALFHKNTSTALSQSNARLQECVEREFNLSPRSQIFTAMLAYNQGDVNSMMEILELPIFYRIRNTKVVSILVLGYVELGRLVEAMAVLKGVLSSGLKNKIFIDVGQMFFNAVKAQDDVEMKQEAILLERMLKEGDCFYKCSLPVFINYQIGFTEFTRMNEIYHPFKQDRIDKRNEERST